MYFFYICYFWFWLGVLGVYLFGGQKHCMDIMSGKHWSRFTFSLIIALRVYRKCTIINALALHILSVGMILTIFQIRKCEFLS
jgi:hypothetical protein